MSEWLGNGKCETAERRVSRHMAILKEREGWNSWGPGNFACGAGEQSILDL